MSKILEEIEDLKSKLRFEDFIFYNDDGSLLGYYEEGMLSYLLEEDVLFCNDIIDSEGDRCLVLYVLTSDIWMWACADAEGITLDELPELCKMYMEDKSWGLVKWACKKRGMRPQKPIRDDMIRDSVWDEEEMAKLKPNYDEK